MSPARFAAMQPLLDVFPEPLILVQRDGALLHVNHAAAQWLGRESRALTGKPLGDLLAEPLDKVAALLVQGWRSGRFTPGRARWRRHDGPEDCRFELARVAATDLHPAAVVLRLRPGAAASGRFLALNDRIEALSREIARRRSAERALTEQREWLEVVLRSIGDAVIATDADGVVVFMNPVAEQLCGWLADDARGRPATTVMDLRDGDGRTLSRHPVTMALATACIVGLDEGSLLQAREGGRVPVDDAAGPIVADDGQVLGVVVVFREISERVHAERERRELERRFRAAQKMEAIGTLAGGIAHDFNNVLGAILGNAGLARDEIEPGHPAAPRLAQIDRAGRRARELVRQIMAFSRRQPQKIERVDLGALVRECVALLRGTLPSSVEIVATGDPEAPLFVQGDAAQIDQVLMNLCTNAWQAMVDGTGRIEVSWRLVGGELPTGLIAGLYPWGGEPRVRLGVQDNGVGMDPPTLQRMFEPFFTTRSQDGGTGLGLSVVHGIVAEHRGQLAVRSEPGRGTCFEVYLPWAGEGTHPVVEAVPDPAGEALRVQGAGRRILVVDDDEMMRMTLDALLRRDGFEVRTCPGGQAALSMLAASAETDLVVTDHNMPGMTGLDLATAIRQRHPALPIVITSGYLSEDLRRGAAVIGRLTLLNKEDCFDRLPTLIDGILARP